MRFIVLAAALLSAGFTGCASIISGVNQPISIETHMNGESVVGAACKLSSNKGTWFVISPGSLTVHRGFQDMLVECSKPGIDSSTDSVASSVRPLYFGNILFGGIIGLAVDAGDGAGFDYPDLISIDMGRNVVPAVVAPTSSANPMNAPATRVAPGATPMTPVAAPRAAIYTKPVAAAPWSDPPAPVVPAVVAKAPSNTVYKYMIAAEAYAKDLHTCSGKPQATLATSGPGYETYVVTCDSGDSLIERCDFGHCRSLQ